MSSVIKLLQEMPAARERLAYASRMTEAAAHEVLTLVEAAQPECRAMASRSREMAQALQRLAASPALSVDRARSIVQLCAGLTERMAVFADAQRAVLSDIQLRQSFQDLSGQVIARAVALIGDAEARLADTAPPIDTVDEQPSDRPPLHGPQVPGQALDQAAVDEVMASLGF